MSSLLKDWSFYIIAQILLLIGTISIISFSHKYYPQNIVPFTDAILIVVSILFGFLTLSITIHLEELRRQIQDISNLAANLLHLLNNVRKDEKLAKKRIHFQTRYEKWGFKGLSVTANAEEVILSAYNYLLHNARSVVSSCRRLIFWWASLGLGLMLVSISVCILSKIVLMEQEFVLTMVLFSIVFGGPTTILGWWFSDKKLEENSDTLFNIQHTILGDLYLENYTGGYKRHR